MRLHTYAIVGGVFTLGGILFAIPSITRSEARLPVSLDRAIPVQELDHANLLAGEASLTVSASGLDALATSQVAWGLLAATIGIALILFGYNQTFSAERKGDVRLSVGLALVVLGLIPGVIMRAIDSSVFAGHNIEGVLMVRPQMQFALLVSLAGVAILLARVAKRQTAVVKDDSIAV